MPISNGPARSDRPVGGLDGIAARLADLDERMADLDERLDALERLNPAAGLLRRVDEVYGDALRSGWNGRDRS